MTEESENVKIYSTFEVKQNKVIKTLSVVKLGLQDELKMCRKPILTAKNHLK